MKTLRKLPPLWHRSRTAVLSTSGFAALTAAAWAAWGVPPGLAAAGISCLLLEALGGRGRQ